MRSIGPLVLTGLLVSAFVLEATPAFSGSQRVNQISRYADFDRALSANEMMLQQVVKERDELMQKDQAREKNPRLLKNRIKILSSKIEYLQQQLRFEKPKAVPAKAQKTAPAVQKQVNVKWKGFAPLAPRRRHYLAFSPTLAQPQPEAEPAARQTATEATPAPKAVTAPVVAAAPAVQPRTVDFKKFLGVSERHEAATQALPVKTQKASAPSERAESQKSAVPERAAVAVEAPAEKPSASKQDEKGRSPKTGADWKPMSRPDKEIYILSMMGNLSRRDVYLMKPYNYYIDAIDRSIETNPAMEEEFIHRILMMAAYESEPDTRKDLEKLWK